MAEFAEDREMRYHSVHPGDQAEAPPDGVEVRLPGGQVGYKRVAQ